MLSDEEIRELPEDPRLAFAQFVEIARQRRDKYAEGRSDWKAERTYVASVRAFAEVYDLALGVDDPPGNDPNFATYFRSFEEKIDFEVLKYRISGIRNVNVPSDFDVKLQKDHREEVHNLINKIRKIVNQADIDLRLKEGILSKLGSLSREIDKMRTSMNVLTDAMLELTSATGQAAENLEPAVKVFERIAGVFGRAKKKQDIEKLAGPEEPKLLEGPLSDEISEASDD